VTPKIGMMRIKSGRTGPFAARIGFNMIKVAANKPNT
jgi:hypothetical protein